MRRFTGVLLIIVLLMSRQAISQPICGFDQRVQEASLNPTLAKQLMQNDQMITDMIRSGRINPTIGLNAETLFTIPVVVHVVHAGGAVGTAYNPSDAQIAATIDYVNQVYKGTADGFSGGAGDMQIQFALAKRDPNCNPTNGIVRVNGGVLPGYVTNGLRYNDAGASETDLKNLSRWSTANYYNIWVVNKIDGKDGTSGQFIAGFAYYPGAPSSVDGTVMLASQFTLGDKTLPHELGHAFFLYHPFNGSNSATQCQSNNNCETEGDRVCDTDPVSQNVTSGVYNFTCRTGINPCTNTPYSPNTENNVMGYTNCFNLFTPGQKARVLAAMTLPSRASLGTSLGGTPTNMGATQCAPKINFETGIASVSESNTALMDCRPYRDYVFNMTIANNPSQAASVTLINAGGTTTNNQDYILTTNNNFLSPSLSLQFPAGSAANRQIQLRVFDDAYIEAEENLILGFSVNGNGGNAVKGDANIVMQINFTDNDREPAPVISRIETIGTLQFALGSAAEGSNPLNNKLQKKKNVWNIRASELTAMGFSAGNIKSMAIYLQKNGGRAFNNLQIQMGTTTRANIVDGTLFGVTTNTLAANLPTFTTVDGWNTIPFTTPFFWNGTSNVVVQLCYDNGTAAASEPSDVTFGYSDGGGSNQGNMYFNNTIGCSETFSTANYYPNGVKPTTRFGMDIPGAITESTLNAANTGYLGPNGEMYFYSSTGNLLGKIKNLTSWDYGCTQVRIDRTGNTTKAFFNNQPSEFAGDKTIVVTPANNNPNGQYEITLFYKKAEVDGFKTGTGTTWSTAGIVKTTNAISSYTPGSVPLGDAMMGTNITRGAYGEDSTLKATFNGGFSGFGIIRSNNLLPVTWLDFGGKMEADNAVLQWSTAAEVNNSHFEVETSRNGNDFIQVGRVESQGAGNTVRTYNYIHSKPLPGLNFYRIRQVDTDGKSSFSSVIGLKRGLNQKAPSVYPNPATNTLMLDWGSLAGKAARWELLSADMKLLSKGSTSQSSSLEKIPVQKLSNGVYILRLICDGEVQTVRFLKQ